MSNSVKIAKKAEKKNCLSSFFTNILKHIINLKNFKWCVFLSIYLLFHYNKWRKRLLTYLNYVHVLKI